MLIIEHKVRVRATLADRVVVLDRGEKIADGPGASPIAGRSASVSV